MNPDWPGVRQPRCECGHTFGSHRDLRDHRADTGHDMPLVAPLNPNHRGPAADK